MPLLSPWLNSFSTCFLRRHHSPPGPLSPAGWVSRVSRAFGRAPGSGSLNARRACSLAISGFAGLGVAVPGWDLPGHWALEQVHTHGPLASAGNMPSLASRTQRARGCTFLGSCNKLFPLLWRHLHGATRGQQQEAQRGLGMFSSARPSGPGVQAPGTVTPGPLAPAAATGS